MSPQIVIKDEAQTRRRRIFIGVGAALALASAFGLYALGRAQGAVNWESYHVPQQRLQSEGKQLAIENRKLKKANRELTARIVMLKRSADIDSASDVDLRKALTQMQSQVAKAKKDLAFYRGIVSPKEAKAGVRVQQFTVDKTKDARVYTFDLVLIQSARRDKQVRGQVNIRMDGLRGQEAQSLTWKDLELDSKSKVDFSFKYFQQLSGTFRVPKGFDPTLVEIEVDPATGSDDTVVNRYDWSELTKARGKSIEN